MDSYWHRMMKARLGRRRLLLATGGAASAAALLAACGGSSDKDSNGGAQEVSGLVTNPVDTSKQAKRGGSFSLQVNGAPPSFTPFTAGAPRTAHTNYSYSKLIRAKPGVNTAWTGDVEGDMASSWELSQDKMSITFKLRPNGKFDPRPPTNGRAVDANDAAYSWKFFEATGFRRGDLANAVNSQAAVVSMTAVDATTLVVKLAAPDSSVMNFFATTEYFCIMPKEADGGFDTRADQRGSGPFYLAESIPGVNYTYKRNPGYWEQDKPYFDEMKWTVIPEYAQALAQFKTGAVHQWASTPGVRPDDILPTKRDVPNLQLYLNDITPPTSMMFHGYAEGNKSPFVDQRVRQAWALSQDRDLFIETFFSPSKFASEGVPLQKRWSSAVRGDEEGWWLDPQSKDFGENAKYYQRDIAEAKKLLSAAGYPNGLDVVSHSITTSDYGIDFPKWNEVMMGMALEAGIRTTVDPPSFTTDWRPKYADSKGNFPGISFIILPNANGDAGGWLFSVFNSKGGAYKGFDANGKVAGAGDPYLDDLTVKILREFDQKKRWALAWDLQKYEAKTQYMPQAPGGASGLLLNWPAISNFRVNRGFSLLSYLYYWLDETQAPVKKA